MLKQIEHDLEKKSGQMPVSTPGREFCLARGSDWADLIFDYFVSRQSNSPSGE